MTAKLVVLGVNPAWQKILRFEQLAVWKVNRAVKLTEFASGKGVNFCRAAIVAGKASPVLIQAAGGDAGKRLVDDLAREKMTVETVPAGPTRVCVSCCEPDGRCTELIEPSTALTAEQAAALLRAFDAHLRDAGMAAFCGSLPDGSDGAFYRHAADLAAARRVPLLLDTVKDLPELLDRAYRAVVKINREELAKVTGESSVGSGLARLFQHPSLEFAAITDGPEQATAATRERRWTFALPVLDHILSPIGCGDTCGAVMAGELLAGARPEDAFAAGLAAASANCLTELYGDFRPEDAAKILRDIRTVEVTAK